ncbi:MAG: GyrI-like domain-containing protein [Pseudolabrys sp.]|nr:GyrI-like domain-containing protein [Pseudolabrys sp.]
MADGREMTSGVVECAKSQRIAGIAASREIRMSRLAAFSAATMLALGSIAAAQTLPAAPPAIPMSPSPSPLQPGDAFGQEVTLPERTIVFIKGEGTWDKAFETLVEAFKSLNQYLDKQALKSNGPAMTIYTSTDDTGFRFQAALPVDAAPKNPPKGDIAVGNAPSGKALKFVHRGSYDAMDSTYEAITNYLDEKRLEAKDLFIEEYNGDPVTADQNKLIVNVFVPIK